MRQVHATSRPNCRPALFGAALLAVVTIVPAVSALARNHGLLSRPPGARRTVKEASSRFLALGNAYLQPCSLAAAPIYHQRDVPPFPPATFRHRHIWQGAVRANGQLLDLILNDNTGNLMCAFSSTETSEPPQAPEVTAPVDTPAQAARLSVRTARNLQMIPAGAEVALKEMPLHSHFDDRWRVAWRVRNGPMAPSYSLTVVLSGKNGRMLSVCNGKELADKRNE